jgi:hypothetical protein
LVIFPHKFHPPLSSSLFLTFFSSLFLSKTESGLQKSSTMIEPEQKTDDASKALARKRRIELRSKKRHSEDDEHGEKRACNRDDDFYTVVPDDDSSVPQKPSIRGIKKQARYDPGVPMTKEDLVAWRKEARRVRNRESAAASRSRTRERIDELEGEMTVLQSKYSAALQRIVELETAAAAHDTVSPFTLPQDASIVSPSHSTLSSPQHLSTPIATPEDSFTLEERDFQEAAQKYQHIIEMITRPNA